MNAVVLGSAPELEAKRLDVLYSYLQLDTARDAAFDLLAEAAAEICQVPYAAVTLVDRDRVWVKAGVGMQQGDVPRNESCCSKAIMQSEFLEIPDLSKDSRTNTLTILPRDLGAQMYAGANLVTTDGFRIGTLCVMDKQPRQLSERQKHILAGLAGQVMSLIELRAHERTLKEALERAEFLASTDVLTGLQNRRMLFERLNQEVARSRRYKTPLSAVLVDLDHFKLINDTHGHAAGDLVLKNVGQAIGKSVRTVDIAARYGGEEFCILLPQTGLDGAMSFAEALCKKLGELTHNFDGKQLTVTASVGVASTQSSPCDASNLINTADVALYASKDGGRNRVSSARCTE